MDDLFLFFGWGRGGVSGKVRGEKRPPFCFGGRGAGKEEGFLVGHWGWGHEREEILRNYPHAL